MLRALDLRFHKDEEKSDEGQAYSQSGPYGPPPSYSEAAAQKCAEDAAQKCVDFAFAQMLDADSSDESKHEDPNHLGESKDNEESDDEAEVVAQVEKFKEEAAQAKAKQEEAEAVAQVEKFELKAAAQAKAEQEEAEAVAQVEKFELKAAAQAKAEQEEADSILAQHLYDTEEEDPTTSCLPSFSWAWFFRRS
jgi:hypothetical protein